jgi:methylenetetrahydrofolate dehydrogenase (NADP+) / methenyltetrahydrofolate cyclohydrolase
MSAQPIDGKAVAAKIMKKTARFRARLDREPGLAAVLVGDDPASHLYVRLKEKACRDTGIRFEKLIFPAGTSSDKVITAIDELNRRADIDAILVQLPLPTGLDENAVIAAMDPAKDVDGFHPENVAALMRGRPRLLPGLAAGIMELIRSTGVRPDGRQAVVVANSRTFYEPLARVLADAGASPAYIHPDDGRLAAAAAAADMLIVAIGRPRMITGKMVKPGAVVIDVGTNRFGKQVIGDVDADSVKAVAGHLTPVPGGVGPVTVAMLMANTVALAAARQSKK